MSRILWTKLREAAVSVFPVAALVILLNLTPLVHFSWSELIVFLLCAVLLVLGIGLFNLGADLAMTPMGTHIGAGLTKSCRVFVLLAVCFAMGVLITVAEPDLSVLASQVAAVLNGKLLIVTVGVGVGLFLLIAVVKILAGHTLSAILFFFYMMMFAFAALLAAQGNTDFLALSFDSGGVTTGPITVPFIMALGVGIASTLGGRNVGENSFGLIALCSIGPILAVMLLGTTASGTLSYTLADYAMPDSFGEVVRILGETAGEIALALLLIVAFFAFLQIARLHLPLKKLQQIAVGILFTFAGLLIFLTAVKIGFMPIGYKMECDLAGNSSVWLVAAAFVLGAVVVLAEPAVLVLNKQVEEITEGTVSRRSMMIALSVGVGLSIGLSLIRIVFDFNVLYYLIPGYCLSLGLSFFVPGLYTAIAFDSGGVASGPLTSSFILPFAVGACYVLQGESRILADGFGIVAMVAMTPLITIQMLGFRAVVTQRVRNKIAMRRILQADDEQIIEFM